MQDDTPGEPPWAIETAETAASVPATGDGTNSQPTPERERALLVVGIGASAGGRHPIDAFMTSLSRDCGASAIGVIPSGAGSDGALGLHSIKEAGGITFAQDPNTATHSSMPQSAIDAGCVDFAMSPLEIGDELMRISAHPLTAVKRLPHLLRAESTNEELQSINEELETSKEELQSSNEELATVNEELHTRLRQLATTKDDLANLLVSISAPVVIVGADLRIRRFSKAAEKELSLKPFGRDSREAMTFSAQCIAAEGERPAMTLVVMDYARPFGAPP